MAAANLFADDDAAHLLLADGHGRLSLWPAHLAVPDGWTMIHGPDRREACLDQATARWPAPGS